MRQTETQLPPSRATTERIRNRELQRAATAFLKERGCTWNGQPRRDTRSPSADVVERQVRRDQAGIMLLIETSRYSSAVAATGHYRVT